MKKKMILIISKTDELCSFSDEYFEAKDATKLKDFVERLGYEVSIEETDQRFANCLNPLRREVIRDIDWTDYRNITKVIKLSLKLAEEEFKDSIIDEQICKELGSEGSGFSITVKRGQIMTQYALLAKLDGKTVDETHLEKISKLIAKRYQKTDAAIKNQIERMKRKGCCFEGAGYPECENGFHKGCLKCPHNKDAGSPIKDETDILRFNEVLNNYWEDY
ncbi:MAG: hypothetical protein V1743_05640 [Nanoarchaeota archaeon]